LAAKAAGAGCFAFPIRRWERNAWKQVNPVATGKDVVNERTLVSGGQYRVNGQYYFTVDF
jgi:hypothetical protein